ncbi:MAG: ATP-binding cassette domain-containing protein [Clostridia bacterium]|nr:ATP-binding cassette domain-containing protein [Clostridia bacterium]
MDNRHAICLRNVCKRFKAQQVLDRICADWDCGAIHGIIGYNGSGKTVLLKLICGLMPASDGVITVSGVAIDSAVNIPKGIGAIIESPGFLPYYSGYLNLKFLADVRGVIGKGEIEAVMRLVGLDPSSRKKLWAYSLGMRQRLGIAQAIMEDPPILILDEPMNGLDKQGVQDIRQLLKTLRNRGKNIILASHNREDIDVLCDDVYEMDAGKLSRVR